jgi:hypothetical protein
MAHGWWIVLIVFAVLLVAAGLGMTLQARLHERHKTSQTTDHVRLVISILVTITALVLSLLLSEVKGSFDAFDSRMRAFAGDLSNLDLHLREYGDDAKPIRTIVREYLAADIADSWREEPPPPGDYPKFANRNGVERRQLGAILAKADAEVHRLDPPDKYHERLATVLAEQMDDALAARRRLIETAHDTLTWPLMAAMCAWLAVVFAVFGLLAPRNSVVHVTIIICALCVASAVFLIDDYDKPLDGLLHVSSEPMRETLAEMDHP